MNVRKPPPADWEQRAAKAVARGEKVDRWIPAVLLDSKISRAGYWYATTAGWVWGTIWSTGRVEKRNGLWVFRGLPVWAFPRGGWCVGGCYLTGDEKVTDRVLKHEAVHAEQWRRYGLLMAPLYWLSGRDPLRNRFEIEAGLHDGNYLSRSIRYGSPLNRD